MSDQVQVESTIYNEPGVFYPQATVGGYTATFEPGVTVEPPLPAPAGVTAEPSSDTSVTVTWEPVEGAASYTVTYYRTDTPDATQTMPADASPAEVTGLETGIEYGFQVNAVTPEGAQGAKSEPVTATPGGGEQLPTPTDVAASNITDTTADIAWTAVVGADQYSVTYLPGGETPQTVTEPTIPLTGLADGTEYTVSVVAQDTTGANTDSEPGTVTFTASDTAQLPAPANITASAITDTTATVTWDAVTGADNYDVTYEPGGTTPQNVTEPTIDLTGLTAGTEYTVSVVAKDSTGAASDSEPGTGTFTTTGAGTQLPTPQNVTTANITDTQADIVWDEVTGADQYPLAWALASDPDTPVGTNTAVASPFLVQGLTAGTEYVASVVARDSTGSATDSEPGTTTFTTTGAGTQLPTPTGGAASAITDTTATVSWDAVTGADGYTVNYTPGGTEQAVTDPTVDLTGLTPGTAYTVTLVATDSTGAAADSEAATVEFTTTGEPPQLTTPANIDAPTVAATTATVTWNAVTGADGYTVNYTPGGTEQTVTEPTVDLTGLTPETEYNVTVIATDSTGANADSDPGAGAFTTTAA